MRKKILISGGSGLIGSYLVNALLAEDCYELFMIVRNEKLPEHGDNIKRINIDFDSDWDINDLPPDLFAVVHLSQAENFRDFPDKAREVFYINTVSTLKLIDFASKNKVSHFIYASSGGVYGNDGIFKEEQKTEYKREMGFYMGTKYCSEIVLDNYCNFLNVIILRFFFVYGKGQNQSMLIPRLLNRVKAGKPIDLQGQNGMNINPVHATDAAKAIIASLKFKSSCKLNVAGPEVLSLREISETIGRVLGKTPHFAIDINIVPKHLVGDISKMKDLLIEPSMKFEDGIKAMI